MARALINYPELILANEPTGELDEENTRLDLEILRNYAHAGHGVMLMTHGMEATAYGDRLLRMKEDFW